MDLNWVILSPVISEKSMKEADSKKYTFKVDKNANKNHIKKAIKEKFNVDVINVSTLITKSRKRREGKRREEISLPSFKKAIVTLKPDQKIGLFSVSKE